MIDVYNEIEKCIEVGEVEEIENLIKNAINLKYPPQIILEKGLLKGIDRVTKDLESGTMTIPEVLLSSLTMQEGMDILSPYLENNKKIKIKAIIGTVEGDLHDIGKDMVRILIESIGIEVIDLGVDVPLHEFVKKVREEKPDILLISSLLTTTINEIDKIIKELKKSKLRKNISIFVGGKSVDKTFCDRVDADYYFETALDVRKFIVNNISRFQREVK